MNNKTKGKKGEKEACDYLQARGYEILVRNYRHRRNEIDIITRTENILVFVEVKTRSGVAYGYPEDFISEQQADRIMEAADAYVHKTDWNGRIRFDVISIIQGTGKEITHFEDAFG